MHVYLSPHHDDACFSIGHRAGRLGGELVNLLRDHVATLLAVRESYDALPRRCTLFLYEDLPYASALRARDIGLERAGEIFAGSSLRPIVEALQPQDAQRKMQWIGFYASQHRGPPRAEAFTPASGMATGLHEIVWQVSPPEIVQA